IGPDLGTAELRGSVTQIAGRMWNHWPDMAQAMESLGVVPPQFRQGELADLFAYIFIVRYDGLDGDPRRGETVYRMKGCAGCHGADARGDIGPALHDIDHDATKETIMQRMWNHAPQMWDTMGDNQIPWPPFEAKELADLLAFLARGLERGTTSARGRR
ncbi:MAG: c-type cytochrome, partial [Acidobacteriota bacterium]